MSSFVNKLKQKPEDVRNRIAIFTAISLTAIIVGLWMLVAQNKNTQDEVKERSMREDLKPLMMIFGKSKE
ncbi:MAG: hypothetical protein QG580_393 [Patescibacteria group bacterium]|jgi:amino acid permease|nr:hypothetical protein [Patescibacteria group bacterium]